MHPMGQAWPKCSLHLFFLLLLQINQSKTKKSMTDQQRIHTPTSDDTRLQGLMRQHCGYAIDALERCRLMGNGQGSCEKLERDRNQCLAIHFPAFGQVARGCRDSLAAFHECITTAKRAKNTNAYVKPKDDCGPTSRTLAACIHDKVSLDDPALGNAFYLIVAGADWTVGQASP
ncbi:hypothetical protein BC828DRAFT_377866 [Blastocladiella britannica]|nr:hypothetical protein BC828DRAFT_377866 [Blastocladiella britannica]